MPTGQSATAACGSSSAAIIPENSRPRLESTLSQDLDPTIDALAETSCRCTNAARRGKASLGRDAGAARKFFPCARPALLVPSLRTQRDGIRISSPRGDSEPLLANTG